MYRLNRLCATLLLATAALPALAADADAHVHGQANLDVAVDTALLTLILKSPTDSLVGFEHPARTAKEREAVERMKQTLEQADKLFQPTPAASCRLVTIKLASVLLGDAPEPGHSGHADLDASLVFRCAQPERLRDLEVRLFQAFPRLGKLNVAIAGPNGQKAMQLTATQNRTSW